ncbi:hypothetical protein [Hymenobacter sp.]|uniref:hypothetical protein n=1 Tax=Hymenobacter sp. TaxID=1898978 RepID=UPI00286B186C|nr:hypothetical protein [Hymenobacter sp.]
MQQNTTTTYSQPAASLVAPAFTASPTQSRLQTAGRIIYGSALLAFGLELLLTGAPLKGLMPLPTPAGLGPVLVYGTGALLAVAGAGIIVGYQLRLAAWLAVAVLGAVLLLTHVFKLLAAPLNPREWTPTFELVAMLGGALVLAGRPRLGRRLVAVALLVFAVLHALFGPFVATLIPAWIPGRLFWAYFVGAAFLAAGLSLLLNRYVRLGAGLLGLMFSLWVLGLHGPRVLANPLIEAEWTSAVLALGMAGVGYLLARSTASPQSISAEPHDLVPSVPKLGAS